MAEFPTFHAHEIDVHLTSDGTKAVLTAVNPQDGLTVTLPIDALILLEGRISCALVERAPKSSLQ